MPTLPPVPVTIAKPVEREVVNYQEFTGNTAAIKSVDIRARVSGYLDKVGFDEGAIVKAGQMLFVIDPRPYQAAFDQAQANVDQAQAQLELAKSNLKRDEDLRQKGVISPQDYETALATRDQASASLLSTQAALETAKLNLEFTQVRSPIDGRTSTYNYTIGNLIAGGDTSSSGVLTTVVSLDPMYDAKRNRMKQKDLAKDLGVVPQQLSDWLRGHRTPNAERILKIQEYLRSKKS